ncbi:hypothetical protein DFR65_10485 [Oceanihabitans sediminis]|uniref:Lipocalin-like domain-containing protein n=1 Tax=Oceanihabitans sediminis TaxID=1812012 RepID=A0A368P3Z7_9FLAO|nr:hypothetical protein [Oceanihabitans sediminis]RBP30827.1 hypothetical protein DFR65_10485 [Oceanihabitans sediminis]RCU56794.1 hypothetical protein DU428_10590 [Oceanihabitans sediminis]
MKHYALILVTFLVFSCSADPKTYIEHINGYWEIEEVTLHNGEKKAYNYNDTIDYFEINDSLNGFRKKLKPNFSGTFETSKDVENIKLVLENDSLNIYYTTPFSKWKETVLLATKEQLKIVNQNKHVYLYKRYQPLDLD